MMAALRSIRENTAPSRKILSAWILLFAAFLIPSFVFADVIFLKNGQKITTQVLEEDANQVVYEVGGGELAIPKSAVDHIEKLSSPEVGAGHDAAKPGRDVPLPITSPVENDTVKSAVIRDDAIDEAYLTELTDTAIQTPTPENLRKLKEAYQASAVFLTHKGDPEGAILRYRDALRYLPHDSGLTLALGYLLWKQEHYLEAVDLLSPAADRYPQSANLRVLLGSAYYGMENLDQAVIEWKKALAIHDDPPLREAITRAEREREVSGDYSELRDEHFLLRYDAEKNERLSGEILRSLQGSFQDLVLDLDYSPTETVVVLLYPNQDFRDITRTPTWVGALNDGKIRIPISGLTQVTPDLARVLKHELTHSFVRQITLGHCPIWFNEGLAQLEDGSTTAAMGSQLARSMASGQTAPLSSLEGSFIGLTTDQAQIAYAKSLAALEYLRDTFGMGEVRRILPQLATKGFEPVIQDEIRMTYPTFEDEVTKYVTKKYGP